MGKSLTLSLEPLLLGDPSFFSPGGGRMFVLPGFLSVLPVTQYVNISPLPFMSVIPRGSSVCVPRTFSASYVSGLQCIFSAERV